MRYGKNYYFNVTLFMQHPLVSMLTDGGSENNPTEKVHQLQPILARSKFGKTLCKKRQIMAKVC